MAELNQTNKISVGNNMLYNFTEQGKGNWRVQDDVVMGGRSQSYMKMTEEGKARFYGEVSLENNGGFCSIHQVVAEEPYTTDKAHSAFVLHVKGDGKVYNFRVRTPNGRHSYAADFTTKAGEWQTIKLPFATMEATFRGRKVDVPNYAGENILEMQLLIGNKKPQDFSILIESIGLE